MLVRMIGNCNAKELQISWKFKIKMIINNGEQELTQQETQHNS